MTGKGDETAVWFMGLCFEIRSRQMYNSLHNSSTPACHHLHQQHALKRTLLINTERQRWNDRLIFSLMMHVMSNGALWNIFTQTCSEEDVCLVALEALNFGQGTQRTGLCEWTEKAEKYPTVCGFLRNRSFSRSKYFKSLNFKAPC